MTELAVGRVFRADAPPYTKLLAGVIANALDDARAGDGEAVRWLRNEGRDWLAWLLPDGADPDAVHAKVMHLALPDGREPARQMRIESLDILELEVAG